MHALLGMVQHCFVSVKMTFIIALCVDVEQLCGVLRTLEFWRLMQWAQKESLVPKDYLNWKGFPGLHATPRQL